MADASTVTISLDNTKEWNIKVTVTDVFATTTYLLNLDKGIPIIFFDRQKRSVGVNTFPEDDGSFEHDGEFVLSKLGFYSFSSPAIEASAGYLRIASLKITTTYANMPIEFEIYQRGLDSAVRLYLRFENSNSNDPSVSSFKYLNIGATGFEAYAIKTSSSNWDVYVRKTESYDAVSVKITVPQYMRQRLIFDFEEDFQSSKPSGAVTATVLA